MQHIVGTTRLLLCDEQKFKDCSTLSPINPIRIAPCTLCADPLPIRCGSLPGALRAAPCNTVMSRYPYCSTQPRRKPPIVRYSVVRKYCNLQHLSSVNPFSQPFTPVPEPPAAGPQTYCRDPVHPLRSLCKPPEPAGPHSLRSLRRIPEVLNPLRTMRTEVGTQWFPSGSSRNHF